MGGGSTACVAVAIATGSGSTANGTWAVATVGRAGSTVGALAVTSVGGPPPSTTWLAGASVRLACATTACGAEVSEGEAAWQAARRRAATTPTRARCGAAAGRGCAAGLEVIAGER
jgi:hypothetical protein